jgi:addiction module RelE/StbE family toxin
MKVRYTPRARAELYEIYRYLDERSPKSARHIEQLIRRLVEGLADFPEAGRVTDLAGVRVLLAGRFPYLILYRVLGDESHVLHIRHTSREGWRGE